MGAEGTLEDRPGTADPHSFLLIFFFSVLRFELRVFTLSPFVTGFFPEGSCELFAQAGLKL
jgi:hypothetical protein